MVLHTELAIAAAAGPAHHHPHLAALARPHLPIAISATRTPSSTSSEAIVRRRALVTASAHPQDQGTRHDQAICPLPLPLSIPLVDVSYRIHPTARMADAPLRWASTTTAPSL